MKMMCRAVLGFEVIVVLLAIPVALAFDERTALVVFGALAVVALLIVSLGLMSKPRGLTVGWIAQAAMLMYGLIEPWMFIVGGVFVVLWWAAIHYGSKVEAADRVASEPSKE